MMKSQVSELNHDDQVLISILKNTRWRSGEDGLISQSMLQKKIMSLDVYAKDLPAELIYRFLFWKYMDLDLMRSGDCTWILMDDPEFDVRLSWDREGLYYSICGQEGHQNSTFWQSFIDFWERGPLFPIPSIEIRKRVLDRIKATLTSDDEILLCGHFDILDYPDVTREPLWEESDLLSGRRFELLPFGLKSMQWNFRDGMPSSFYYSFENILNLREDEDPSIPKEVIQIVHSLFWPSVMKSRKLNPQKLDIRFAEKIFRHFGGRMDLLEKEGYAGCIPDDLSLQVLWRESLEEDVLKSLSSQTDYSNLILVLNQLKELGVDHPAGLLHRAAMGSDLKFRQLAERYLFENGFDELGFDLLLSFLQFAVVQDYWLHYFYGRLNKLSQSSSCKKWISAQLEQPDQVHFEKCLEVLLFWCSMGYWNPVGYSEFRSELLLYRSKRYEGGKDWLKSLQEKLREK